MAELFADFDLFKFVVGFCLGGVTYAAYSCVGTLQKILKELEAIRHLTKNAPERRGIEE